MQVANAEENHGRDDSCFLRYRLEEDIVLTLVLGYSQRRRLSMLQLLDENLMRMLSGEVKKEFWATRKQHGLVTPPTSPRHMVCPHPARRGQEAA